MILQARQHTLRFPRPAVLMGIVNLSADSFSGDGVPEVEAALERARDLRAAGAEIIDVGAESARTNREAICVAEESDRLAAMVTAWQASELSGTLLSLNTWRPEVVRAVLPLGGDLLNDIGGLPTPENAELCARYGAALLVMHTVGSPKVPHTHVGYGDLVAEVEAHLAGKLEMALAAGLAPEAVVLDPGFDFAKSGEDNLRLFRGLGRLHRLGRPLLLPISRKTFIGEVLGLAEPAARDAGTVACLVEGLRQGAQIFRVHNVRAAAQAARVVEAIAAAVAWE